MMQLQNHQLFQNIFKKEIILDSHTQDDLSINLQIDANKTDIIKSSPLELMYNKFPIKKKECNALGPKCYLEIPTTALSHI